MPRRHGVSRRTVRGLLRRLGGIERHLLPLVLATTVVGLAAPGLGTALTSAVTPALAFLMLASA